MEKNPELPTLATVFHCLQRKPSSLQCSSSMTCGQFLTPSWSRHVDFPNMQMLRIHRAIIPLDSMKSDLSQNGLERSPNEPGANQGPVAGNYVVDPTSPNLDDFCGTYTNWRMWLCLRFIRILLCLLDALKGNLNNFSSSWANGMYTGVSLGI